MAERTRRSPTGRAALLATVAVAGVVGLIARLWLLHAQPLNSDEAVVGLMGGQIRSGHTYTFFWAQAYGGVEPYLVAGWSVAWGRSALLLNSVPIVLYGAAAVVVGLTARRLMPERARAAGWVAGSLFWAGPAALYYNSTRELGFRATTMVLGPAAILLALRLRHRPTGARAAALGVVLGLGWWSSPEILYFVAPVGAALIATWTGPVRGGPTRPGEQAGAGGPAGRGGRAAQAALCAGGLLVGAGPWIYTNTRTGWASLRPSSSPTHTHSHYVDRLGTFFGHALPLALGVRMPLTGAWLHGLVGEVLYGLVLAVLAGAAAVALSRWRGRPEGAGLGVAVVGFPFVYAAFPATSYWQEGQYVTYFAPLYMLLVTAALGAAVARRQPDGRPRADRKADDRVGVERAGVDRVPVDRVPVDWVAAGGVLAATAVSAAAFTQLWLGGHPSRLTHGWGDPNALAEQAATALEAGGVKYGYAQYWVAYDTDYLTGGRLRLTAAGGVVRWPALDRQVHRAARPAWIFYAPGRYVAAFYTYFSGVPGPDGLTEDRFVSDLTARGAPFRVVHAGVLDAVIPE